MKKTLLIFIVFVLYVVGLKTFGSKKVLHAAKQELTEKATLLEVGTRPVIYRPSRVGINLGRWTSWGTQQFSSNILLNPGYEGKIDRVIVIVSQFDQNGFLGEAGWGYPDNYWNDAEFYIQTGCSAGKKGVITRSLNSGKGGLPQYFVKEALPSLNEGDIIVLTKLQREGPLNSWKVNNRELVTHDPYERRPKSTGDQSVRLLPTRTSPAEVLFFSDRIAPRSGKMMPIEGPWRLSFWAKADTPTTDLEVSFRRTNESAAFLQKVVSLSSEWQQYTFDFTGEDVGKPAVLQLSFKATRPSRSVWLDDVVLSSVQNSGAIFRKAVVDALKFLQPSYLREFPHLGDTWENRTSDPFQRKPFTLRTAGRKVQQIYSYSLIEFLNLCEEVNANPWIILPPTFSQYECEQFAEFLLNHANQKRFSDIIVEFGSENWNWLNRSTAIPYPKPHGLSADRCFKLISNVIKQQVNVRFLVNGQVETPSIALEFIDHSKQAHGLGATAYYFNTLNKATPDQEVLKDLFSEQRPEMSTLSDELFYRGKSFAIAEINLHATRGDAKHYERNRVVTGRASGSSLAKQIIESLYAGADPVMVHNLGQFDTVAWEVEDFVNLFGVVRDFGPPVLFRPTGLVVVMLNQVISGNMYPLMPINSDIKVPSFITAAAFKTPDYWSVAVVSAQDKPINLCIAFPDDGHPIATKVLALDSNDPFDTNEFEKNVEIIKSPAQINERIVNFTVPEWGFVVLTDTEDIPIISQN